MSSPGEPAQAELPAVDDRLVAPDSGFEIDDGKLIQVAPADEPHAISHGALGALLRAHRDAATYSVAIDMLTRTSLTSDLAPDASIYPAARDPQTGGRQLEELAFEILSTERRGHAGAKAAKLVARGVRRVFGIDVVRRRAFEWSRELGDWTLLASDAVIEDRALAVPLEMAALVDAAEADDATVRAFRLQRHPEFLAEREEGRQEGREQGRQEAREEARVETLRTLLCDLLALKFGPLAAEDEARIAAAGADLLDRYLARVVLVATLDEVWQS